MPDLPPLIVDIVGNAAGLLQTLTEVDAALSAFADKDYTAYLDLDISKVLAKATEAIHDKLIVRVMEIIDGQFQKRMEKLNGCRVCQPIVLLHSASTFSDRAACDG